MSRLEPIGLVISNRVADGTSISVGGCRLVVFFFFVKTEQKSEFPFHAIFRFGNFVDLSELFRLLPKRNVFILTTGRELFIH